MSNKAITTGKNIRTKSYYESPKLTADILSDDRSILKTFYYDEIVSLSEETIRINKLVGDLTNPTPPGSLVAIDTEKSLEEKLFDATANVKILTSKVAMHFEKEWRDKIFKQLDSLHDPEEWESDDKPIQSASFATFLKAIFQIKPQRRPGLGLSTAGYLIASWSTKMDRLTIEFMPENRVKWVLSQKCDDEYEYFAGQTAVYRLFQSLSPYNADKWFSS